MADTVSTITLAVHAIVTDRTMDCAAVEAIKAGLDDGHVTGLDQYEEDGERVITIRVKLKADA